jgi:hypothetical protein
MTGDRRFEVFTGVTIKIMVLWDVRYRWPPWPVTGIA